MMYSLKKDYPFVRVDLKKLRHNINEVVKLCMEQGIQVAGIVKGFNAIPETLKLYQDSECVSIGSSRLEHIAAAREAGCAGPFLSIRIPMLSEITDLVSLADMSLNSEITVIRAIDAECEKQGKIHGIILMADLGDLREGYWDKQELVRTAIEVEKELKHVRLLGVGTNLGCYGSIDATPEKMEELIGVAEMVEAEIGRKLEIISGGGSTSLPLVLKKTMPERINHLRIGEGIEIARDLHDFWGLDISFLHPDVFTLHAEIIEIKDKPSYPVGDIFVDCFGNKGEYVDRGIRKRAVVACGKVDFALDSQLDPKLPGIEVLGASSDHLLLDIEDNKDHLKVGDIVEFTLHYSTVVFLTSSKYVRIECV